MKEFPLNYDHENKMLEHSCFMYFIKDDHKLYSFDLINAL